MTENTGNSSNICEAARTEKESKGRACLTAVIAVPLLIFFDLLTKYLAVTILKPIGSVPLIKGVLELTYLENRGAAFGMLQGGRGLFIPLTILVVLLFAFIYLNTPLKKKYLPMRIVLIFFIAGAVGNFIDRVVNGYVVDFIYFSLIDFPVFNVADIYVTCSCIALFVLVLFIYKEEDLEAIWKKTRIGKK